MPKTLVKITIPILKAWMSNVK